MPFRRGPGRTGTRAAWALVVALLLGLTGFLLWHEAVPAYQRAQPVPEMSATEPLALPTQVFDPPPYAPSTEKWGPPGPVGLVFQGRTAREGFTTEISDPWFAVSARTGEYWRLEAPHLDRAARLWLSPRGTQIAWSWPGGIWRYDTMTGESEGYPVEGAATGGPLVWSPDATRLAFGRDPVRVLDMRTGEVTGLSLRVPDGSAAVPAWTPDGRWVTVAAGDGLQAVEVASGQRRTVPARVGGLRGAEWNRAGDVAGMHPGQHGNVLRVLHAPELGGTGDGSGDASGAGSGRGVRVVDESPENLVIYGFWGWVDSGEVVLTGLRPETGALEQAMAMSLTDDSLRTYMQFPTLGDNWVGMSTVSLAGDLLERPTRDFGRPALPWSPGAKLLLCTLVAVFPVLYFLIAHRPRARRRG